MTPSSASKNEITTWGRFRSLLALYAIFCGLCLLGYLIALLNSDSFLTYTPFALYISLGGPYLLIPWHYILSIKSAWGFEIIMILIYPIPFFLGVCILLGVLARTSFSLKTLRGFLILFFGIPTFILLCAIIQSLITR